MIQKINVINEHFICYVIIFQIDLLIFYIKINILLNLILCVVILTKINFFQYLEK